MSSSPTPRGQLFVVSAPSGTGKTTLVDTLVASTPHLRISRSYTTRRARVGEVDRVDYDFVSRDRFDAMIAGDQFLEWADIYGDLYGTSQVDTERIQSEGDDLVLVIDVQGARKIRRRGVPVVAVFVLPPSFDILESRLRGRSTDGEAQIQRRLEVARGEVRAFREYDFVVVNDDLGPAVERLRAIVVAARLTLAAATPDAERIAATFDAGGP
jgi:guanylate kinase